MRNRSGQITLKKILVPVFLAVFVLASFHLAETAVASSTPQCFDGGALKTCIQVTDTSPVQPEQNKNFQVNAVLTVEGFSSVGESVTVDVKWMANPSGIDDISAIVAEGSVTMTADASLKASSNISKTFNASGRFILGQNTIGAKFVLVSSFGNAQRMDTLNFTVIAAQVSANDSVTIRAEVDTSDRFGLRYNLEALYIPAGQTTSIRDATKAVIWNFGDSSPEVNDGYVISHTFPKVGAYTVSVKIQSGTTIVAESSLTVTVGNVSGGGEDVFSGALLDTIGGLLLTIVNVVLGIILAVLRWIIWILGNYIFVPLLEATLALEAGEIASGPILVGWQFVRDVVNMFFILFLIIIGFGTILKFENYSYKKLLVNLIVMAMLVNFSLLIGRIIIQIADAAQFNFLPVGEGASGVRALFQYLSTAHLGSIVDGFRAIKGGFDTAQAFASTFTLIFQFILELGVIITFGAMAIFMLIRTVALWILLILAPAAYALFVLPTTVGLAKQWWLTFMKYVLFAPIFAFFLRLTLVLYRDGLNIIPLPGAAPWSGTGDLITKINVTATSGGGFSFEQGLQLALVYVMILAFLWAGLLVSRQMGIFGANAIVGLAERGMRFGVGAAAYLPRAGLGLAGQKYNEWTSRLISEKAGFGRKLLYAVLNPVGTYRGFAMRREERRGAAKEIATGAGHEVAASFWTRGKEKIPYKELAMRKIEREQVRKLREAMGEDIDKAEARDFYKRVVDVGGLEGDLLRGAYLKLVVAQGYGDDFTEVSGTPKYADKLKIPQDQRGIYNDRTFQTHAWATVGLDMEVLKKLREVQGYKDSGEYKSWLEKENTQKKLRNLAELTNPAKDIGHYEQMYTAVRDETLEAKGIKAAFRPVVDEEFTGGLKERTDMILGETVKIPIRDFMRSVTWHNLIPKVFKNGQWTTGDVVDERGKLLLSPYQLAMIKKIGPEYVDQATHMQGRTVKYTVGQWVAEDGTVTNPVQFDALRKINTGFADVLRNISVYGRPRPTATDLKDIAGRGREIHIKEIIDRENLDERVRGVVTKAYEEVHAGNWSRQDAATHIATANIPPATISRVLGDISEALAKRQAGLIVPTAYAPRTVAAALTPQQIQQLSDAVQQGVKQGFAAGNKFADPASKASLKVAIKTEIEPVLRSVNVSPADIDSISDAMAEEANKKI